MRWDNQNMDEIFRDAYRNQSFEYSKDFFKEVEPHLFPQRLAKGRFAWIFLASSFVLGLWLTFDTKKDLKILPGAKSMQTNSNFSSLRNTGIAENSNKLAPNSTVGIAPTLKPVLPPIALLNLETNLLNSTVSVHSEKYFPDNIAKPSLFNSALDEKSLSVQFADRGAMSLETSPIGSMEVDIQKLQTLTVQKLLVQEKDYPLQPNFTKRKSIQQGGFVTANAHLGTLDFNGKRTHTKTYGLGAGYSMYRGNMGFSIAVLGELQKANIYFTEASKHYAYDYTYSENILNYSTFYKMDFPLWLHYRKKKNNAHAGLLVSCIFNSKLDYTHKVNGEVRRQQTVYGADQGINTSLFNLQAGYGFQVTKRFELGVNATYRLNKMVNQEKTNNTAVSPFSGEIYIRHSFR